MSVTKTFGIVRHMPVCDFCIFAKTNIHSSPSAFSFWMNILGWLTKMAFRRG